MKPELLAPCGNMEKLNTALHFGADAVYLAGKQAGLRAFAGNFSDEELRDAVKTCHALSKKVYVTVNIFAYEDDFVMLGDYLKFLHQIGVDAIIVSDVGIIDFCKKTVPDLEIHLSTQASTTNSYAIRFWAEQGVKRIVLAREVSLENIKKIKDKIGDSAELEAFVHGAMCVSYSGRCLLSNFLVNRPANRGECAQACRWEYVVHEVKRPELPMDIKEDERGTYIFNSRDLNMLSHLKLLRDAGVDSFKIEGRMKTAYYVGTVVNAYRRAIDLIEKGEEVTEELINETYKAGHRSYTTGFYFGGEDNIFLDSSRAVQSHEFSAYVTGFDEQKGVAIIEQRNRFVEGDFLEVLSPSDAFNKKIKIENMTDDKGEIIKDAKFVQQKLYLPTKLKLQKGDILRKENKDA